MYPCMSQHEAGISMPCRQRVFGYEIECEGFSAYLLILYRIFDDVVHQPREYNGGETLASLLDGKSVDMSAEVFKNVSWAESKA